MTKYFFLHLLQLYIMFYIQEMSGKKEISGAASFGPAVWEIRSEIKEESLFPRRRCFVLSVSASGLCCRCVGVLVQCAPV